MSIYLPIGTQAQCRFAPILQFGPLWRERPSLVTGSRLVEHGDQRCYGDQRKVEALAAVIRALRLDWSSAGLVDTLPL